MKVADIKYIILISMVLLSLVGGLIRVSNISAESLSTINLNAPASIPVAGTFIARINVTPGATFNAYQIQISYDPNVIQVMGAEGSPVGVTQGLVGTTVIPIDMWSFFPTGRPGGSIRILGRITGNQSVNGAGYLAEIHFSVIGGAGQNTAITPTGTQFFSNDLFDSDGKQLATVTPWGGATVQVYLPLQINTLSLPAASVENNYSINLAAAGGTPSYTWNATGLPSGLTITGDGTIAGKPAQAGDFSLHLSVTDSAVPTALAQSDLILHVYPAFQITNSSLPEATQGAGYSAAVNTTAAVPPFNWTATGLPGGMNISSSGVVSGNPTVSGDYNISITATDSYNPTHSVTKTLPIHIYASLQITTALLPVASTENSYNADLAFSGGKAPYTWTAAGLPVGLSLSSSGSIGGTPVSAGDYNVTAYISDSFVPANTASRALTLHVSPPPQIITTSLPEGVVGKTFSAFLTASGGIPPYSWSATGLPAELTCSAAGAISGIPEAPGPATVKVTLTDSVNPANTRNVTLNLNINDALIFTVDKLPEGLIGKAYSASLSASGSRSPYAWTVTGLPSGLAVSNAGAVGGTPAVTGDFVLNVSVTDSLSPSYTTTGTVTLKIYKVGDANGDGSVNIGDITYVERVILGLSPETPGCDASLNGSVSIGDVTMIERIILKLV
jgi:hypothetical protein